MCVKAYTVHVEERSGGSGGVSGERGEDIGIHGRGYENERVWLEEVLIVGDNTGRLEILISEKLRVSLFIDWHTSFTK
jgi:hypothetical protein